ncbi:MAG TPA: hypothetical protein VNK23_08535 [Candidatus Dormibacteraeota bacterium]|nr:hypothetical protein [Candidatus Dormibacteraeota bacterium]
MFQGQRVFACLTLAACALAISPRPASAKNTRDITATMDVPAATSLGGKALKPGTYKVIVGGSTVTMKSGNKVAAEAPATWKQGSSKPPYSSIVTDAKGIEEIHFEGKTGYVEVQE